MTLMRVSMHTFTKNAAKILKEPCTACFTLLPYVGAYSYISSLPLPVIVTTTMDKLASKFKKHFRGESYSAPSSPQRSSAPNKLFQVGDHDAAGGGAADGSAPSPREVQVQNVIELGNVSSTSTLVKRDLGFQGKLGNYILLSYGDTMFTDSSGSDEFRGMTCNSLAIACEDPTQVFDPLLGDNGYPHCFLIPSKEYGEDPSKYALGITNVVETSHGNGKSEQLHLYLAY